MVLDNEFYSETAKEKNNMKGALRLGFADAIITPPHPEYTYLDGYGFRLSPASEGVRDDLHAKVCAMVDGEKIFLLFSLDIIGLRKDTYRLVSSQISDLTGVAREDIALSCIHTHAAPASGILDELPIDTDYFAYVGEVCGRAALRAIERACPVRASFAILPETLQTSHNRREGRDVIDRSIRAVAFHDANGKLCGVITSAACHAVVNTAYSISADWLAQLNKLSTDEVPYLFLQGRGADINPQLYLKLPIDEMIERLGSELAIPVAHFAANSPQGDILDGEIKRRYEIVRIPMKRMTDLAFVKAEIAKQSEAYRAISPDDIQKHFVLRQLQWWRHMENMIENGEDFALCVPLQVLAIGKACVFLFVPFELLTLTGNKLEDMFAAAGFARETIYVCGYSNMTEGYLAPVEEFPYGGYEVAGAAHWYNIPEASPESEPTLLDWFRKVSQELK